MVQRVTFLAPTVKIGNTEFDTHGARFAARGAEKVDAADDVVANTYLQATFVANTDLNSRGFVGNTYLQSALGSLPYVSNTYLQAQGYGFGDVANTYLQNSIVAPLNVKQVQFTQTGTLTVKTGTARWYVPQNITIANATPYVGTAPTATSVLCSVKKNGTEIYALGVGASLTSGQSNTTAVSAVENDYITVDITQIGAASAGENLFVVLKYTTDI